MTGEDPVGAHTDLHNDQGPSQESIRGGHGIRSSRFTTLPGWSSRSLILFGLKHFHEHLVSAPHFALQASWVCAVPTLARPAC